MTTARRAIVLVLLATGLCLAIILLFAHHGEGPAVATVEKICGEGKEGGCKEVNTGPFSSVGRIPVAALGVSFYASLGLLIALGLFAESGAANLGDYIAFLLVGLGLLVDLILLGVQAALIHHFCSLCGLTYVVNGVIFVLLLGTRKAPRAPLERGGGSLLLGAWALGTASILAGAISGEAALTLRERIRAPSILGSVPSGGAEAQRLQGILDDPVKLDQYLNEKASRDFDAAAVVALDLKGVPVRGKEGSPIAVVDYSDFLCPFCRQAAQGFANWLPQSGGRVAFYYKNFPLDTTCNDRIKTMIHPGACVVALGGVCAQEQGKFWAYHDKVFSEPPLQNPTAQDVVRIATKAGLDGGALGVCLDSAGAKNTLSAQIHEGSDSGVQGTPTVFVDGKKLPRIDHFLESIEKEARRLGLPPPPSPQAP